MASVTVPTAAACDLVLASNADPSASVAYQEFGDASPTHTYARANSGQGVVVEIAGRTTPVGFRKTEGRADVFQRTLEVAIDQAGLPVAVPDRAPFDPLLALIEDTAVGTLALCDGHGRRWFVFAEFVQGSYAWEGHENLADVKFTEVATVPDIVTTGSPATP